MSFETGLQWFLFPRAETDSDWPQIVRFGPKARQEIVVVSLSLALCLKEIYQTCEIRKKDGEIAIHRLHVEGQSAQKQSHLAEKQT